MTRYSPHDTPEIVQACIRQLTLEQQDLIAARDYEGMLELADIAEFEEEHGYPPFDTDEFYAEGWRGDQRLADIATALEALSKLKEIFS